MKNLSPPESHARRRTDGSWYVETLWQNGRSQEVGDFRTENEAEELIKNRLKAWHEGPAKEHNN
ncbi:MAG: hypothetical protein ACI9XZ_004169 [Alphaproteobacteria bacterium]|jgi:hypothetical protein